MQANTPQGQNQQGQGQNGKPTLTWSQPQSAAPVEPKTTPLSSAPKSNVKMTAPEKSSMSSYVGVFVGGLVVGILIGWGVVSVRSNNATEAANMMGGTAATATATNTAMGGTSTGTSMDLSGSMVGADQLSIPTPQAAGLTVSVSHISVSAPTWVIVYEDHAGVPGNALGAELFYPASQGGETSGAVQLLRGTLPGQTYLVGEAVDDGDHIFSLATDKPVRDQSGNPVLTQFKTN